MMVSSNIEGDAMDLDGGTENGEDNLPLDDPQFQTMCQGLSISDEIKEKAWSLWVALSSTHPELLKGVRTEWFACILYMTTVDSRMPYGPLDPHLQCGYLTVPAVCVTDLLLTGNFAITTFFQRMRDLKDVYHLSDTVKHHLINLEKRYCIVSAIFHTFNRICKEVFKDEVSETVMQNEDGNPDCPSETDTPMYRKKFCWTLFLLCKGMFLHDGQELVHGFQILLCCLEYTLRTLPIFLLKPIFAIARQEAENPNLLQTLSEQFNACFDEVNSVMHSCIEPFAQHLQYKDGELDLQNMRDLYMTSYVKEGGVNELLFLEQDPLVFPTENFRSQSLQKESASCIDQKMTPVRAALNTVQQLKNILAQTGDEPSASLKEFFKDCSQNPEDSISHRVIDLKQLFVDKFIESTSPSLKNTALQRFMLGVRLYYKVMEALLKFEKERLSQNDFSTLLNIDTFHRSLLACALEVVIVTYGISWNPSMSAMSGDNSEFSFPWILDVFKLKAYDFYKVLESFIKAEPKPTRDILKHLQTVENRILESIAWEEDSPLFEYMSKSEITQMSVPPHPGNEGSNTSAADLYLSPMKVKPSSAASPHANPSSSPKPTNPTPTVGPVPGGSPSKCIIKIPQSPSKQANGTAKRSQSLMLFFNKVCKLGYHRLQTLCGLLGVSKELQHKIWTCFEFCVTHKPELMRNRHLDQLMMCSIYAICKVVEKEIKFKTIVSMYRNMPHAEQHVFKSALIDGKEHDSIIGFYNRIYMHTMKAYILQFSNTRSAQMPSLSPKPVLKASPVYSLPGKKNFYVSPLRESAFKTPASPSQMTPRSRQLYSFGEGLGSSEKLKNINESLSAYKARHPNPAPPRSQKRLKFDLPDDSSPGITPSFRENGNVNGMNSEQEEQSENR